MTIQLDLTDTEYQMLVEILDTRLSDLRMEIAATEIQAFREELKEKKEMLKKVLAELKG